MYWRGSSRCDRSIARAATRSVPMGDAESNQVRSCNLRHKSGPRNDGYGEGVTAKRTRE